MGDTVTVQSLKSLLRYPFQREGWHREFLIGSGLLFIGFFVPFVPNVFVLGYATRVMRQAIEGRRLTLPAWDDWRDLGLHGLRCLAIQAVYALPGLVVLIGGFGLYVGATLLTPLLSIFAERTPEVMTFFPFALLGSLVVLFVSMSLGSLLLVVGAVPLPMATVHAVAQDRIGAAFRLSKWWAYLRNNKLGYFAAWIIMSGLFTLFYVGLILAYYTIVFCAIVPLAAAPVAFYFILIGAAVFGQTYREGVLQSEANPC
ncbi:MAG: DUF4013 domain-containing protein [Anaerolineae bacterium]